MSNPKHRKIILASPKEPCGATWLINCLLSLNVMTYRDLPIGMWVPRRGKFVLNKHNEGLKKWLPVLSEHKEFSFRDNIEVQWTHEWPRLEHRQHQVIFFVRDPRDALFSACKRDAPEMRLNDYVNFPDTVSLLDRIDNHLLCARAWLGQPNVAVVRFEDYKQDARKTLQDVLSCIDVKATDQEINNAIEGSTFEKAAQAEKRYREAHPEDSRFICRSGKVGDYKQESCNADVIENIEARCVELLDHFGYLSNFSGEQHNRSFRDITEKLSFFRNVDLPRRSLGPEGAPEVVFSQSLISEWSPEVLRRRNLSYYDFVTLIRSIEEYTGEKRISLTLTKSQVWAINKSYLDLIRVIIEHPQLKPFNLTSNFMKVYFKMRAMFS